MYQDTIPTRPTEDYKTFIKDKYKKVSTYTLPQTIKPIKEDTNEEETREEETHGGKNNKTRKRNKYYPTIHTNNPTQITDYCKSLTSRHYSINNYKHNVNFTRNRTTTKSASGKRRDAKSGKHSRDSRRKRRNKTMHINHSSRRRRI